MNSLFSSYEQITFVFLESWKKLEVHSHVKAEEIISYGAGNISLSPIARYQFAFLALLAETLEVGYIFVVWY